MDRHDRWQPQRWSSVLHRSSTDVVVGQDSLGDQEDSSDLCLDTPSPLSECFVSLTEQLSSAECSEGSTFGCDGEQEPWLSGCQVLSDDLSGWRALSGTVRCLCQTSCQVLSGACLTSEGIWCCRSCQSCQAAATVRRRAGAVRCYRVVLSGCCQALTHTPATPKVFTIKRRPAGLFYRLHIL